MKRIGNSILNKAKYSNNTDEWYTDYKTIEKEVIHYKSQLNGKKILCNCDDPYESAFAKYFIKNFNNLKLKKLVCISYSKSVMHTSEDDKGLILVVENIPNKLDNTLNDEDIWKYLQESFTNLSKLFLKQILLTSNN
ncbi:adenine-specific methyltransferase EcoRI family protein [Arcobacter sp. CECT 8989]|uniref:adenine-specific methyltransferase EcoRI family protein n=1 Tax=Arcobacter sp. CECT 8989 TaxID=2044509 RepID=UPI002159C57F|nr:adenine-specific methyltransferase EcoRI family protein [Arcobacter sp. CECT 8989]